MVCKGNEQITEWLSSTTISLYSWGLRKARVVSSWDFLTSARSNQWGWLSALSRRVILQRTRSQGSDWTLQPRSVHTLLHGSLVLMKLKMFLQVICLIKVIVFDAFFVKGSTSFPSFYTPLRCVSWHPIGYWCSPGQTVATALPCPPGHFCPQGSAAPEPCPSGTYQDREKQEACTVCEAGGSRHHYFFIFFNILSRSFYFFYFF